MQINRPQVIKVNNISTNQILNLNVNVGEYALIKSEVAHSMVEFIISSKHCAYR